MTFMFFGTIKTASCRTDVFSLSVLPGNAGTWTSKSQAKHALFQYPMGVVEGLVRTLAPP